MEIDERLRAVGRSVDAEGFAAISAELAEQVAREHRPLLRRKRRLIALGVVGAVLVPSAAIAATVHFRAETGQYGKPGMTENDTSQFIDMCASDFTSYVASIAPTTRPLPAGTTWAAIISKVATKPPGDCPPTGPGAIEQTTGIKVRLLSVSECPWQADFLSAHAAGNSSEARRAGNAVASAEDAIQALGGHGDNGWRILRDGAARGDAAVVKQSYQANCAGLNLSGGTK